MSIRIATIVLPLLYTLTTVAYGFVFFADDRRARRMTRPLLAVTLAFHFVYLTLLTVRWSQFPVATVSQALSAVALAVSLVYALVERLGRESSTGFWMLAPAGVFELLSALMRTEQPPNREIFHSPLFATHTGLALLGHAAFVLAAGYGFLFLRLYYELKRRRFSLFFDKLPPLEVLERMMLGALVAGFVALAGTVVSGGIWAHQAFDEPWQTDPKILGTVFILIFYGVALLMRRIDRWHGRQMAIVALAGIVAIMFSLIAVNIFFTDLHDFM
jgi:ABC-type uncharacterized transport system permease subunit